MENNTKIMELKIKVTERTNKDGGKFLSYSTVAKDGKRYDVRFKKTAKNVPQKSCVCYVKIENISIDKRYAYPRIWLEEVEFTKDYSVLNGETIAAMFEEVE